MSINSDKHVTGSDPTTEEQEQEHVLRLKKELESLQATPGPAVQQSEEGEPRDKPGR